MQNPLRSLIRHAILGIALFAAASAQALTWSNDTPAGAPSGVNVRSIWGSSATNIYAALGNNVVGGVGRVYRWQGSAWTGVGGTTFDTSPARSIFGFGTQELWVGGLGGAMRRSTDAGATWNMVNSGIAADDRMTAMWGASNTDIWAGGRNSATSQSVLLRYNGSTWTTVTTAFGADEIRGIWGSGANSVFFVGLGGKISRWDGSTLSPMTSGTIETLVAVWGLSANEVYAVGQYNIAAQVSTIIKWNGSTWSPFPTTGLPVGILVNGITGSSSNDLYVCLGDSVANLYHWNGTTWSQETTAGNPLNTIWGSPDNSRIVAGGSSSRLYGATATAPASAPTVTTATQSGVTHNSATLGGNVTADGGASVTERGIVWGTSANPTTANNKVQIGTGTGVFSQLVTGLPPSTTIHVRAYAINSADTAYGSGISFTTNPAPVAVSSLNRVNATPTNAGTVNWTLTFGSAVTGVTASNFALTGAAAAGLSVGTPSTGNGGLTWNIPVNTGATDGALTLTLANSTGLSAAISTSLPFAGETYTIDKTPPTVVSVTRLTPTGQQTNLTTVTFRVTYSEPVALNAPETARFQVVPLNGSNIVGTVTGVSGGGDTRDVTVNLTGGTGEFRLRVID